MLFDQRRDTRFVARAERVEQVGMCLDGNIAEIRVGDVAGEQKDVDLRAEIAPTIIQPLVASSLVDQVVKADIELRHFFFGWAARQRYVESRHHSLQRREV